MDTPLDSRSACRTRQRSAILGSVTIPGKPAAVGSARDFVRRLIASAAELPPVDSDAATLLTSELVTNAIVHSDSGRPGGTVTIVAIGVPDGLLVEVIDEGSADAPVVKSDLFAADGRGLFLVQQLAAQWGYLRDPAGTTVWFHLPATAEADGYPGPGPGTRPVSCRGGAATADASAAASTAPQMAATSRSPLT